MTPTQRAAIERAIDCAFSPYCVQDLGKLIPDLRAALAEPAVQEPVGYLAFRDGRPSWDEDCVCKDAVYPVDSDDDRVSVAIYTTPQAPKPAPWQEPRAVHQVRLDYGRWSDLGDDELKNFVAKDGWELRTLYTAPVQQPPADVPMLTDAARYKKLRRWMSSNVKEGWEEVERLGGVASWMSWDDFDAYLDALPECAVGLMSPPIATDAVRQKAGLK